MRIRDDDITPHNSSLSAKSTKKARKRKRKERERERERERKKGLLGTHLQDLNSEKDKNFENILLKFKILISLKPFNFFNRLSGIPVSSLKEFHWLIMIHKLGT